MAAEGAEDEEGEGESGADPEEGGGDGGGMDLRRAMAADVNEFDREEGEDEEVKAYPVADRSFGEHLFWMLQRGEATCTEGVAVRARRGRVDGALVPRTWCQTCV